MTCYMTKVAMCTSIWEFNMLFFILWQFQKFCMSESNFLPVFHTNFLLGLKFMERNTVYIYIWRDFIRFPYFLYMLERKIYYKGATPKEKS